MWEWIRKSLGKNEQAQKDKLWKMFSDSIIAATEKKREVNDNYRPIHIERYVEDYMNAYCFMKKESYFAPSKIKPLVEKITRHSKELNLVKHRERFSESLNEGITTAILRNGQGSYENEFIDALKKQDFKTCNEYVNKALLNFLKAVESRNNNLILKYKRKDHIIGRYETIIENAQIVSKWFFDSNNKNKCVMIAYEIERRAKVRLDDFKISIRKN